MRKKIMFVGVLVVIFICSMNLDAETHGATGIKGGTHTTADEDYSPGDSSYTITASTASPWHFVDPTHVTGGGSWSVNQGSSSVSADATIPEEEDAMEWFSVKIYGKIAKESEGEGEAPLPDWSVKGNMTGNYEINPEKLILHVVETGKFEATDGTSPVDSNWEVMTLDGTWTTHLETGNPNLNIGPGGDYPLTGSSYQEGRYIVTGKNASNDKQNDTAELVIYNSELTFEKQGGICAKTTWSGIGEDDYQNTITLKTTPIGYEKLLELKIDSTTPINSDNGKLTGENTEYIYTALTEVINDKRPGDDETRSWDVVLKAKIKKSDEVVEDRTQFVYSVFKYYANPKSNKPKALEYMLWKYPISTAGLASLSYKEGQGPAGWTTATNHCTLGDGAFGTENICASVVVHENLHGV